MPRPPKTSKCTICSKGFSNDRYLSKHMKILHKNGKDFKYPCLLCCKVFFSSSDLKKHKWKYHESEKLNRCTINVK